MKLMTGKGFLLLAFAIAVVASGLPYAIEAYAPYHGIYVCPNILARPTKADLVNYINLSNQSNGYGYCADSALEYYNKSGILQKYGIEINISALELTLNSSTTQPAKQLPVELIKSNKISIANTEPIPFGGSQTVHSNITNSYQGIVENVSALNWAGWAVTSSNCGLSCGSSPKTITMVNGSWIVQTSLPTSKPTYAAQWVGIGGYTESTLIQTGTSSEYHDGGAVYYAWYELLPQFSTTINNFTVAPGDLIHAKVLCVLACSSATEHWTIIINDITENEIAIINTTYASSRQSAEWIEERPGVNGGLSNITDFGRAFFGMGYTAINRSDYATVGSNTLPIGFLNSSAITMVNSSNTLVTPSVLSQNKTSFNVLAAQTVNTLVINVITPNTQTVDQNENISVNEIAASGGVPPYKYQWLVRLTNVVTFSNQTALSASTCLACQFTTNSQTAVGNYFLNFNAVDNAGSNAMSGIVNVFVKNAIAITISANSNAILLTQNAVITANVAGGAGPFNIIWGKSNTITNSIITPTTSSSTFNAKITTPGVYKFNVTVVDNGTTAKYTMNSIPVLITVNAPINVSIVPSSANVDLGQNIILFANVIGGTAPYQYRWLEIAPPNSIGTNNFITEADCGSTNSVTCNFITTQNTLTGNYNFEVNSIDANSVSIISLVANVAIANDLSGNIVAPATQFITQGDTATLASSISSGSLPYKYNWLVATPSSGNAFSSIDCAPAQNTPTCNFTTTSSTSAGNYTFKLQINDSANATYNTPVVNVIVNQSQSNNGGGGGSTGGEGGGGGGGGGTFRPSITNESSGFIISNVTQLGNFQVVFCGTIKKVTDNFVTPTYTGVTINGAQYSLQLNLPVVIGNIGAGPCYVKLLNITYLPILQTAKLQFYQNITNFSNGSQNAIANAAGNSVIISVNLLTNPPTIKETNGSASATDLVSIHNITGDIYPPPSGFEIIYASNITVNSSADASSIEITKGFDCGENPKPFILNEGSWKPIQPYFVNQTSCTIGFALPADPVTAIMIPIPSSSKLGSTVVSQRTSVDSTVVQIEQAPSQQIRSSMLTYEELGVAVIAIIAVAYLIRRGQRSKKKSTKSRPKS